MKKILATLMIMLLIAVTLSGCGNRQIFDTTYKFDKAIISLPNGDVIEGKVDSWIDYEDGDQIQVKINGVTYLVHSSDIVLIKEN
jgi:ABC-type glycerol-3-phosphate transport system substrate-binding protein